MTLAGRPWALWRILEFQEDISRVLDQAATFRGYPDAVRTDQGPEFTGKALDQWAYRNNVEIKLIQAGKPTQNAYIESFNGQFRDGCPDEHYLTSLAGAREIISTRRKDYNEFRPHSTLGQLPTAEFAARFREATKGKLDLETEDPAN
jgi:putative transposase